MSMQETIFHQVKLLSGPLEECND